MNRRDLIKIAIVEDDRFFNKSLQKYISTICNPSLYQKLNFQISAYLNANDAILNLEDDLDFMVLDYYLFDAQSTDYLNGESVLNEVNKYCDNCKVIMMSEFLDSEKIYRLTRKGVYQIIDKKLNTKNRLGAILQHEFSALTSA